MSAAALILIGVAAGAALTVIIGGWIVLSLLDEIEHLRRELTLADGLLESTTGEAH